MSTSDREPEHSEEEKELDNKEEEQVLHLDILKVDKDYPAVEELIKQLKGNTKGALAKQLFCLVSGIAGNTVTEEATPLLFFLGNQ
eukprot:CAMPEP_0185020928 /NCGR_PEP_ID=MMETSP1103-20130426/3579_1 /TAXON_ID=36769 /ORGANISM="Paraphysomonas bandaiensis, Strain Caron Lab Isolate" /LENGTH=85 /DNA_ID=CAMNT_0027552131 /DNA_START=38 /DNA_END=295 /DNA_ORIENTATION=+